MNNMFLRTRKLIKNFCLSLVAYLRWYPARAFYARLRAIYIMLALLLLLWIMSGDWLSLSKLGVYFYCTDVFDNPFAWSDIGWFWENWRPLNQYQFNLISIGFQELYFELSEHNTSVSKTTPTDENSVFAKTLLSFLMKLIPFGSLSDLLLVIMIFPTSLGIYMIFMYLVRNGFVPAVAHGLVYSYAVERVAKPRLELFYDFILSISKVIFLSLEEAAANVPWLLNQWSVLNSIVRGGNGAALDSRESFILKPQSFLFKTFIQYHPQATEAQLYALFLFIICGLLLVIVYYKPASISGLGVLWRLLCLVFFVSPVVIILLSLGSSLLHVYYMLLASLLALTCKLSRWDEKDVTESTWRWYILSIVFYIAFVYIYSSIFYVVGLL